MAGIFNSREGVAIPTTLKIGGSAELFYQPRGILKVLRCCETLDRNSIPYRILGGGSNLLVDDRGVKGAVVRPDWLPDELVIRDNRVEAPAGMEFSRLIKTAAKARLAGLEFAAGIPGTVGGAVAMNAGWGGEEIAGVIHRVWIYRPGFGVAVLDPAGCRFSYRDSRFHKEREVILKVELRLRSGDRKEMAEKTREVLNQRREALPLEYPSAGSVFKNPAGDFAGRLIESAGLKGKRVGDAQISEKHANVIVNLGNASSRDVRSLIKLVRQEVRQQFGISLELEIKIWES